MSLVEGTSALQNTAETANTLKVVGDSVAETTKIYSISNYLEDTQSSQAQAAMAAWTFSDALKAYVPQVVTGISATASGAYTASVGGLAYILSTPVAFAAMAGALGIGVGVGLYQVNPDFWDKVSSRLVETGAIVGNGILSIYKDGKTYIPESTINTVRELLLEEGAYNTTGKYIDDPTEYDLTIERCTMPFDINTGDAHFNWNTDSYFDLTILSGDPISSFFLSDTSGYRTINVVLASEEPFSFTFEGSGIVSRTYNGSRVVKNNKTYYYYGLSANSVNLENLITNVSYQITNIHGAPRIISDIAYVMLFGDGGESAVEGLEKQSGATYPSETTDIPTEYPDWWVDGIEFLKPITREVGNNPTLDPDDYEQVKALPVEIPDTVGDPTETGYEEEQSTIQEGDITDPGEMPAPLPPDVPWQRVIKGVQDITDPDPDPNPDPFPSDVPEPVPEPEPAIEDPPSPDPPTEPTGDTPVVLPPSSGFGTGMNAVYNPTKAQLRDFNSFLWSDDFVDTIKKILNDPMQAIISLQMVYCTPQTSGTETIVVGTLDSEVPSKIVSNQYVEIDCGTITIPEYFLDYTDYSPYTQVICFLPFIGFVNLETDDVIGSAVNIKYTVDLYTSTCLAEIKITKGNFNGVIYTFSGNCGVQLPLSSGTHSGIIASLASLASSVGKFSSGNILGGVASAAQFGYNLMKQDVQRSGSITANAGAMGIKKPYILVRRPVPYNASHYNYYHGIPSNTTVKLSTLKGYTRIKETHVELIESATDNEKEMILNLLQSGVVI